MRCHTTFSCADVPLHAPEVLPPIVLGTAVVDGELNIVVEDSAARWLRFKEGEAGVVLSFDAWAAIEALRSIYFQCRPAPKSVMMLGVDGESNES